MSLRRLCSVMMVGLALMNSAVAGVDGGELGQKMRVMALALRNLTKPGATDPLIDLKNLREAAVDCFDHSDEWAPAAIIGDEPALIVLKSMFGVLRDKVEVLEKAWTLPSDDPTREAQIKDAIAKINDLKKEGHESFKP